MISLKSKQASSCHTSRAGSCSILVVGLPGCHQNCLVCTYQQIGGALAHFSHPPPPPSSLTAKLQRRRTLPESSSLPLGRSSSSTPWPVCRKKRKRKLPNQVCRLLGGWDAPIISSRSILPSPAGQAAVSLLLPLFILQIKLEWNPSRSSTLQGGPSCRWDCISLNI